MTANAIKHLMNMNVEFTLLILVSTTHTVYILFEIASFASLEIVIFLCDEFVQNDLLCTMLDAWLRYGFLNKFYRRKNKYNLILI